MKINLKQNRGLNVANKTVKLFQIRQNWQIDLKQLVAVTICKRDSYTDDECLRDFVKKEGNLKHFGRGRLNGNGDREMHY